MATDGGWTFGKKLANSIRVESLIDVGRLYEESLNHRKNRRKIYETSLNAALENLLSLERLARADGFDIKVLTSRKEAPYPVTSDNGQFVEFVQAYGVAVLDSRSEQ